MATKKKAVKRRRAVNPQPSPMLARMGMSDDWALTIWSPRLKRYVHFLLAAQRVGGGYYIAFDTYGPVDSLIRTTCFATTEDAVEQIEDTYPLW